MTTNTSVSEGIRELIQTVHDLRAENAALLADKAGMQAQIGFLLTTIDDWDKSRADKFNGGLTMHTYGQTPDWYVEAAFWSCYGVPPNDPRASAPEATE